MLYQLLYLLKDFWFGFNVFRYLTVRMVLGAFTSLFAVLYFGPGFIRSLRHLKHPDLLEFHASKYGTPTMGGILIIGSILLSVLLWADLSNKYLLLSLLVMLWLGATGFYDDYTKFIGNQAKGVRPLVKIVSQVALGLTVGLILFFGPFEVATTIYPPFFKEIIWELGAWYLALVILVITAASNTVNITDGLDGLAIGSVLMVAITFTAISYIVGNYVFANYLGITFIRGTEELAVLCASLVGASLGFLWFNAYPAEIFMGDTGSLALGGVLGIVAILIKQEFALLFAGGIFVLEALSVIIQVVSFKTRGKRVFKMTPIHHHFELLGWPESKLVIRFWILAIIFALFSLVTLKIR
ncbi:MAG: Phospho-N-acetylmuramoyl-pentapeptide-transferase [candidate division TA06 bacterium ADurb.Bin417]|uniref:Phospho-N-acetylmuramoyl-pentapeptide-transferase n=1 Tax=candidate division TA06 bacterium ADurb.Bin417 TaxID=1852828 RepID=A0A1V5M9I8_UNCT6|nr:MAG: Phospho-N-acetylmuramoyl-pentapeptide-transferase [candidate division TA06 bacterium ADurb.Bin417]